MTEVPFHCLDFVDVSSASVNQSQSAVVVLSSARTAKQTLEKGPLSGWGKKVKVDENKVTLVLVTILLPVIQVQGGVRSSIWFGSVVQATSMIFLWQWWMVQAPASQESPVSSASILQDSS